MTPRKPPSRERRIAMGQHPWQCVFDPTRTAEYPGDFYGGRMSATDLNARGSLPAEAWPEGITYQNLRTGQCLAFSGRVRKFVPVAGASAVISTGAAPA